MLKAIKPTSAPIPKETSMVATTFKARFLPAFEGAPEIFLTRTATSPFRVEYRAMAHAIDPFHLGKILYDDDPNYPVIWKTRDALQAAFDGTGTFPAAPRWEDFWKEMRNGTDEYVSVFCLSAEDQAWSNTFKPYWSEIRSSITAILNLPSKPRSHPNTKVILEPDQVAVCTGGVLITPWTPEVIVTKADALTKCMQSVQGIHTDNINGKLDRLEEIWINIIAWLGWHPILWPEYVDQARIEAARTLAENLIGGITGSEVL